jgi:hypothetical protein
MFRSGFLKTTRKGAAGYVPEGRSFRNFFLFGSVCFRFPHSHNLQINKTAGKVIL